MINFNGLLVDSETNLLVDNRGFLYGDGVFETLKIRNNKILFIEDHYFRLMAGMRILRMEIPMNFTMEYLEGQILEAAYRNNCTQSARARITVYRSTGGFYLPKDNNIQFLITAQTLQNEFYNFDNAAYEVELFKDFYVTRQLLSSVKSTNRLINITGSIFASENGFQNCLLLNDSKNVVEALQGNVFMLFKNKLITPPIADGCINGIMRKQIISLAKKMDHIEMIEESISPFDLQNADEIFITNIISGIRPVTKYRKKGFGFTLAEMLQHKLNEMIRIA